MVMLIRKQKAMSIEEIMYQVNHHDQAFRQEIKLKNVFLVYFSLNVSIDLVQLVLQLACTNMNEQLSVQKYIFKAEMGFNLAFKSLVFMVMFWHLFHYGRYVFTQTKWQLLIYFSLDFTAYFLSLAQQGSNVDEQEVWVYYVLILCYFGHLPLLMMAMAVLWCKGREDVLMELSKLDYICIVSIF